MTVTDPFAETTDEAQSAETVLDTPPAEAPKKRTAKTTEVVPSASTESKVVVTLKGGSGFDAPWIVIHAVSVDDAYEQFDGKLAELMTKVQAAGKHFAGLAPAKSGGERSASAPPRGAVEPPAGTPPAPGPDWQYKTGVGKNGKTWKAWMPPRDSDESPVWL